MSSFKKLPGVLSFQRGMVLSDGLFWNILRDGSRTPLLVMRHGIRGTQNTANSSVSASASAGSAAKNEVSNIQTTDSAKLSPDACTLGISYHVRFLDVSQSLFACAPGKNDTAESVGEMRGAVSAFTERAKNGNAIELLAERYARNIANGRFAWRNRMAAEEMTTKVFAADGRTIVAEFNSFDVPLRHFDNPSLEEVAVAAVIARGMRGERDATLTIEAHVSFGGGSVEVFPSQNYLEDKEKGFSRPLYFVGSVAANQDARQPKLLGQAALRDQKIGNALRTIDTWYPEYSVLGSPLPVEPNGASLDAQKFFRTGNASGFALLKKLPSLDPSTEEGLFVLACLVRGGVFSGGDK